MSLRKREEIQEVLRDELKIIFSNTTPNCIGDVASGVN